MLLKLWRNWRRGRILAEPFPAGWEEILLRNVRHYSRLSDAEHDKLRRLVQIFVAEKYWEGCGGQEITDEVKVTIAGHACLLLLGFDDEHFDRLLSVLVYPDPYVVPESRRNPIGVVTESIDVHLGEAWHGGPVILAWSSVPAEGHVVQPGRNVVLHEFAHVLDMSDQMVDGTPPLADAARCESWKEVMTAEFRRLRRAARNRRPTLLDKYGATDEAEFFAVASECFFERPVEMQERHTELYDLLSEFYRQAPAKRSGMRDQG